MKNRVVATGSQYVKKPSGLSLRQGTRDLIAILAEQFPGYDPVTAMAEIAHMDGASLEVKAHMHKEIAGYLYAKRKAVDIDMRAKGAVEFRMIIPATIEAEVADET